MYSLYFPLQDQAKWSELFPECGGREQSPIDISMNRLFYNASTRLALDNFSTLSPAYEVVNNGHTVMFSYLGDSATAPAVTGLAGERYELAQFHLHWGQKGVPGSEHTIDGRRYDMELHMVFYNRAKYSIFERAVNSRKNGVLVLGVFYEAKKMANLKLKTLTRNIRKVSDTTLSTFGTAVPVDAPIRLDDLIPEVTPRFPQPIYQYRGSLTIPPCTEGITWLVMATPRIIGRKQVRNFEKKSKIQILTHKTGIFI